MYGDELLGSLRRVRHGWFPWGLRWPLPEVLIDAAPGRGDDCIRLNLVPHDRRHINHERSCPWESHIGRSRILTVASRPASQCFLTLRSTLTVR